MADKILRCGCWATGGEDADLVDHDCRLPKAVAEIQHEIAGRQIFGSLDDDMNKGAIIGLRFALRKLGVEASDDKTS
jgi:hypothetical protein